MDLYRLTSKFQFFLSNCFFHYSVSLAWSHRNPSLWNLKTMRCPRKAFLAQLFYTLLLSDMRLATVSYLVIPSNIQAITLQSVQHTLLIMYVTVKAPTLLISKVRTQWPLISNIWLGSRDWWLRNRIRLDTRKSSYTCPSNMPLWTVRASLVTVKASELKESGRSQKVRLLWCTLSQGHVRNVRICIFRSLWANRWSL